MTGFDAAVLFILDAEGGYSIDPQDPGNWTGGRRGEGILKGTHFGISAAAYPDTDIRGLTADAACAIYRRDYWTPIAGDALPAAVAQVMLDCAVNQGVRAACLILQASVGVTLDGAVGPVTLAALARHPVPDLVNALCARRAVRYAGSPGMAHDGLGWMLRLFTCHAIALALALADSKATPA